MTQRTFLPIEQLIPDPDQPRRKCADDESIDEFARSIQEQGIVQDLLVEGPLPSGKYQIVFGERRYRAALKAGLTEVPVRITAPLDFSERLEIQLFENMIRKDLDIRDRAAGIQRYIQYFPDQKSAAAKLGMTEGRLSQLLELANLRPEVTLLVENKIVRDSSTLAMINQLIKRSPDEAKLIIEKATTEGKISRKEVASTLAPHRRKKPASGASSGDTPKSTAADLSFGNEPDPCPLSSIDQEPLSDSIPFAALVNSASPEQPALEGFENVPVEKISKVRAVLKAPRNTTSRVLIAQLVDAYLTLLEAQSNKASV